MIQNIKESEIYSAVADEIDPIDRAINSWGFIHDQVVSKKYKESVHACRVNTNNISVDVVFGDIPKCIWKDLCLTGHEMYPIDEGGHIFLDKIESALTFIDDEFYNSFGFLFPFLQIIIPTKSVIGFENKLITSLTVPDLPFSSLISINAFIHLAPNIINNGYITYYLAENIFHEMTHNIVNIEILENDLFVEEYSSEISPRVEIEWRKNAIDRNKFWQLDRVMHALHVYSNLYLFRNQCANIEGSGIESYMAFQAKNNGLILIKKILEYREYLTQEGVEYINYAHEKFSK